MTANKFETVTEEKAQAFAERIAEFIKHNNIDLTEYTMEQVVAGWYRIQMKALDEINANEIFAAVEAIA